MAKCKDCFHWNACKKMLETYWGHCVPSDYEGGADRCEDFISAADVVPRAEVAREIFEEIEALFPSDKNFTTISRVTMNRLKNKYAGERDG